MDPEAIIANAIARLQEVRKELPLGTLLWVDDNPLGNINERRMFASLGIYTDAYTTNRHALSAFDRMAGDYDVVISDITRENSPESGWDMLRDIRAKSTDKPFMFYAGYVDAQRQQEARAKGANAITASPHELLEAVVNLLTSKSHGGGS